MRNVLLQLMVATALGCIFTGSAFAERRFSTAFPAGTTTRVGVGIYNGRVFAVEQNVSNGRCHDHVLSPNSTLTDFTYFNAGTGNNWIRMADANWDINLCGKTLTQLREFRYGVWFETGDGHDIIIVNEASRGQPIPGRGDDVVIAWGSYLFDGKSRLGGDAGNDWVINMAGWGRADTLMGWVGNDNLCDLADGSVMDGYEGRDRGWNMLSSSFSVETEMPDGTECSNMAWAALLGIGF